jgi:hypothetical protein
MGHVRARYGVGEISPGIGRDIGNAAADEMLIVGGHGMAVRQLAQDFLAELHVAGVKV